MSSQSENQKAIIQGIINNTKEIYMSDTALTTLMDFERILDNVGIYAFMNWKYGELVSGPVDKKYFIECTFMWNKRQMPDPRGGLRIINYGGQVTFKETTIHLPTKIKTYMDFRPGTHKARMHPVKVWMVTITIPKTVIHNSNMGVMDLGDYTVDIADINRSYEEELNNTVGGKTQAQEGGQPNGQ